MLILLNTYDVQSYLQIQGGVAAGLALANVLPGGLANDELIAIGSIGNLQIFTANLQPFAVLHFPL